jgi:hypothetical protein
LRITSSYRRLVLTECSPTFRPTKPSTRICGYSENREKFERATRGRLLSRSETVQEEGARDKAARRVGESASETLHAIVFEVAESLGAGYLSRKFWGGEAQIWLLDTGISANPWLGGGF